MHIGYSSTSATTSTHLHISTSDTWDHMTTRSRVLSLYRTILRTGRNWQGPQEERDYIWHEAKVLFRQNKELTSAAEIEAKLHEAQDRLDIAVHYQIPYPRMQHAPQFKKRDFEVPIIR